MMFRFGVLAVTSAVLFVASFLRGARVARLSKPRRMTCF